MFYLHFIKIDWNNWFDANSQRLVVFYIATSIAWTLKGCYVEGTKILYDKTKWLFLSGDDLTKMTGVKLTLGYPS